MAFYVDVASRDWDLKKLTENVPKTFQSKKKACSPSLFAVKTVNGNNHVYFSEQTDYAKVVKWLEETATFHYFRTIKHKLVWIINTIWEVIAGLNILSHIKENKYKEENIKTINDLFKHITNNRKCLELKRLYAESLQISVY